MKNVMRSLPKRFRHKATTNEKSKDLDDVKIDELVWSLQTYGFSLPQSKKNKFSTLNIVKRIVTRLIMTPKKMRSLPTLFENLRKSLGIIGDFLISLNVTLVILGTIKERKELLGLPGRGFNLWVIMSARFLDILNLSAQVTRKH